jgi:8-oxo-dGTP pyrophosphatase MutT (NUDIX family)
LPKRQFDVETVNKNINFILGRNMFTISPIISQDDYLKYKHALNDLRTVHRCNKKKQLGRLEVVEGQLSKKSPSDSMTIMREEWQNWVVTKEDPLPLGLRNCIQIIKSMHIKLNVGQQEQAAGEYLLAVDLYHECLKVMKSWNSLWLSNTKAKDLLIHSPHALDSTELQPLIITTKPLTESEKALTRYFELLQEYPQLKRTGEINDHLAGAYEIFYDLTSIHEIQTLTYEAIFKKTQSHELAAKYSIIGVVYEDPWCLIIRDAVISPHKKKHTYIRFYWKSELTAGCSGAAILPVVKTTEGDKIALLLIYRHTTKWEFEIPRGSAQIEETPEQTARRELKAETGFDGSFRHLGNMAPDSGILSSRIPIFRADVTETGKAKQEKTEAIKDYFLFSIEEIKASLKNKDQDGNSYLEVCIKGEKKRYPVEDSFLIYALYQNDLISAGSTSEHLG